jgi:phosphoenolpyruvate carboxylase
VETSSDLQAACTALLPGYSAARREPERWAVLTRACLQRRPVARNGELGPAPAERFDEIALQLLLEPDTDPWSILIVDVQKASDVLCGLWLARRSGLFRPGATPRDCAGTCSRLGFVPSFRAASLGHATYLLATLYANAAYKRHLAARGNTQHVRLDPADGDTHERLARQARSWGVELSA